MTHTTPQAVLDCVVDRYSDLSPQLKRAAQYLLDNVNEIGINSMRQVANDAEVHPNTLVRLARAVGFENYEGMRAPFRESLREPAETFPDRARWLQSLSKGHSHGEILGEMAATSLLNVEQMFAGMDTAQLKQAADAIVASHTTYILGVGAVHSMAHNFWYVTRMALDNLVQIPRMGSLPSDDLVNARNGDVLISMTFAPYRSDVIEATAMAKEQGATILAITDTLSSPIVAGADFAFITPNKTPQIFPSHMAVLALLETLTAFIVADASSDAVARIEEFHRRRFDTGVYDDGKI
ncbi:MAG: MurR/RpiR family transcriptional regulator [Pseudomonadota bacterium]